MKAEDKLYEAMAVLDSDKEYRDKTARELLQQFLRANMTANIGNFNIMAFVGKDPYRPAANGVFHEGGYKVATDHIVLCRVRAEYEPDLEGKIVDKNGAILNENYPKWRSVVPDTGNEGRELSLNLDKLRAISKTLALREKEDRAANGSKIIIGDYEGWWCKRNVLDRLIRFAGHLKDFKAWIRDIGGNKNIMLVLKNSDGEIGLFMGMDKERTTQNNHPSNLVIIKE